MYVYIYIYMSSLRMQLRSAAKAPLPDSDSDVDGGGAAEHVPWLLQLLLSNDRRITKIASDVREGVAPTARQYQSSACCKRWQLQLMLIYTYVYGGNMEGREPKSENQLFHSTNELSLGPKHTLAYTLTDNARAWLAKYDFFIGEVRRPWGPEICSSICHVCSLPEMGEKQRKRRSHVGIPRLGRRPFFSYYPS